MAQSINFEHKISRLLTWNLNFHKSFYFECQNCGKEYSMQSFFAKMRQIIFAIARDFIRQIFDPLTLSSNETFAISVTRPRVKEIEIKSSTRLLRSAQKVIKDLVYFFFCTIILFTLRKIHFLILNIYSACRVKIKFSCAPLPKCYINKWKG